MDALLLDAVASTIVFTVFGVVMGTMLALAAIKFKVEVDPKVQAAKEALPGANCGACGFPGCEGYAEAVCADPDVPTTKCSPGGPSVAQAIAEITGKAMGEMGDSVAVLCCANPGATDNPKYQYEGVATCAGANAAFGGPNPCVYGCIGLGDCALGCPFGAIVMVNQKPVIDYDKCTGCNKCVTMCPKHVLDLVPRAAATIIECRNPEKGANVRSICSKGCISCQMCVRKGPEGVYLLTPQGVKVDYNKSVSADEAAIGEIKCPTKVLHLFAEIKKINYETVGPH